MIEKVKTVETLRVADLQRHSVWQFAGCYLGEETSVRPIENTPVTSLVGRLVGTQVRLANGAIEWALIGNVDPENSHATEHFLTLSILRNDLWFTLARYHDFDYKERGPEALAQFLNHPTREIFPISYDIRSAVTGNAAALYGNFYLEPREKLTRSEVIALAVP